MALYTCHVKSPSAVAVTVVMHIFFWEHSCYAYKDTTIQRSISRLFICHCVPWSHALFTPSLGAALLDSPPPLCVHVLLQAVVTRKRTVRSLIPTTILHYYKNDFASHVKILTEAGTSSDCLHKWLGERSLMPKPTTTLATSMSEHHTPR
jgi:hypothetical protein